MLATGFHTHNYMRPMNLRGRDGISIDDAWAKGPRAYRMTAIPGFPNFFTVLGPNSPTGSISLQYSAELTARYIAQWLKRFRDGDIDTVEVTEEATAKFNDDVGVALGPTVWNTGCNSWYLTDEGNVDLWPYDRKTMTAMLSRTRRSRLPHKRRRLKRWGFVVGGEPGLALSFFFGDEFGAFAAFGVDAVAAVLLAGLLAARHHCGAVGLGYLRVSAVCRSSPVDCARAGNIARAVGFGACRCARSGRSERSCRRAIVHRSSRRRR